MEYKYQYLLYKNRVTVQDKIKRNFLSDLGKGFFVKAIIFTVTVITLLLMKPKMLMSENVVFIETYSKNTLYISPCDVFSYNVTTTELYVMLLVFFASPPNSPVLGQPQMYVSVFKKQYLI